MYRDIISEVVELGQQEGTLRRNLFMGLVTAGGSIISGLIFAGSGYAVMGIVGAILSLIPLGLTGWWMAGRQGLAAA